jgi:hypothetical protein
MHENSDNCMKNREKNKNNAILLHFPLANILKISQC